LKKLLIVASVFDLAREYGRRPERGDPDPAAAATADTASREMHLPN
jgi:hypothetical protein